MKVTPEQKYLKDSIYSLKEGIKKASEKLSSLIDSCSHLLRDLTPEEFAHPYMRVETICEICGKDLNVWRCKESPDGVCHYVTDNENPFKQWAVKLLDDRWDYAFPQDDWNKEEEGEDCIYCKMSK